LSGAGMMCIEATAVEPAGRITPACLGLWNDANESALKPIIASLRRYSKTAIALQLAHAGRKASCQVPWQGGRQIDLADGGWHTMAPSAAPFDASQRAPTALDQDGLRRIAAAFAAAAQRAVQLGVDAIELHAAHGYLIHQFLSPLSNRRGDIYGGSLENRMRYPLEIFEAVRAVLPATMPLGARISATDWVEGGWDLEQSVAFAQELKQRRADWIDVSSGGSSPAQKIALGPGYQVPFAERIRHATGLPVIAVGLITEPRQAEEIIQSGKADLVALARAMLYDPRWAWHAAAELGDHVAAPPQYWRAPPHRYKDLFLQAPGKV